MSAREDIVDWCNTGTEPMFPVALEQLSKLLDAYRDEVLEEAVDVARGYSHCDGCWDLVERIRALKRGKEADR